MPFACKFPYFFQVFRLSLALAPLAGCAVGPDFTAPAAPAVDRYTADVSLTTTAATAVHGGEAQTLAYGQQLPDQWWQLFGSDKLNALVNEALATSPTVASARAALTQAQEVLRAQQGAAVPTVDLVAGAQRQKSFMNFGTPGVIGPLNLFNAGIDVSYGIDLFGGLRRELEGQHALVSYQREEMLATYLTLASNVVTASVQEASLREQLHATQTMVAAQEQQLQVVDRQYQLGATAYSELLNARAELASLRAGLPTLQQDLSAVQTQLAVYLGKLPMQRQESGLALEELTLPATIPLGVPSELVRRRPDVRAAEAMLHKASANVGVATANLFPKFTLSASYGEQSSDTNSFFNNPIWSVGANLTQPLFHGGTLNAQRRAAKAAYEGASADYKQTVLNAFKNVSDALQAVVADAESLQAQHDALLAADDSLKLAEQQYRLGAANYLTLLTAQRQAQQARINYLQRLARRYQDTAALMLALGGDWSQIPDSKSGAAGRINPAESAQAVNASAADATTNSAQE